jgi:hypothetical protein
MRSMADVPKNKSLLITLIASGAVFFILLGLRMDLFRTGPDGPAGTEAVSGGIGETWMSIHQGNRKIGYSHRRIQPADAGYSLHDTTYMRINTMGMVQDLHMRTTAVLTPQRSLDSFTFTLRSNLFDFTVRGKRVGDLLEVQAGSQQIRIPVDGALYLAGGVLDAAISADMDIGETRSEERCGLPPWRMKSCKSRGKASPHGAWSWTSWAPLSSPGSPRTVRW